MLYMMFVEKEGNMIVEKVGQSDPWKGETFCPRKDCLHCQGRFVLAKEQEERAMAKVAGGQPSYTPPKLGGVLGHLACPR